MNGKMKNKKEVERNNANRKRGKRGEGRNDERLCVL